MTTLTQRMREELVRRHYTESTIRRYLRTVEDNARYSIRPPGPHAGYILNRQTMPTSSLYHIQPSQIVMPCGSGSFSPS